MKWASKETHSEYLYTKDLIKKEFALVGDYTYGEPEILQWGEGKKLFIGKFCSISDNVKIFLGGNHRMDWVSTYPFEEIPKFNQGERKIEGHPKSNGDVVIGNDVWIGKGACLMSGIEVGNGAVIAAYSLVTKDVKSYEVVGGNPAKHIRFRFTSEQIKKLNEIAWWNWSEKSIKRRLSDLCNPDISKFIEKYKTGEGIKS